MFGKLVLLFFVVLGVMMAVPSTRSMMVERATPVMDEFRGKIVPGRLEVMADQLAVRVGRGEGFPNNWEGWLERDYTSTAQDPWGNYYFLRSGRNSFTVGSMGPDGEQGTADDITLERRLDGR